jgi:heptosyltransferase III
MAGLLKQKFPQCKIWFLGRTYTQEIVALSDYVDGFLNYDLLENLSHEQQEAEFRKIKADVIVHVFPHKKIAQLAKDAKIGLRVGTRNRVFHWFTCNLRINLSRRNSDLHETQLNFKLLDFLNIETEVSLNKIPAYYGFRKIPPLSPVLQALLDPSKFNLILHPKSKGSAREWSVDNFEKLVALLPASRYKIFISGTREDAHLMPQILANPKIVDLTGRVSLREFIAFIHNCDGLVAASTGPLHIAAALNILAIGLFVPKRPIHPGRWKPLGKNAHFIVFDEKCKDCKNNVKCDCITKIQPEEIVQLLNKNGEF